ncbi:MAG: rod shape-determining protein, partial [Clostridia bacterium]|nr:rod shape-determining protein [Clostridia bacterium]
MKTKIGIDLGDAGIAVCKVGDGQIHKESAVVALSRQDGSFLGIGGETDQYEAGGGGEVVLRRIFQDGTVIPEYTRAAVARLISRYRTSDAGCRVLLSVPCGFGDVEEGALAELAIEAGADEVYLVYAP